MEMEIEISKKKLIKRLQELDKFKHNGSVREGEIELLQEKSTKFLKSENGSSSNSSKKNTKKKNKNINAKEVLMKLNTIRDYIKRENEFLDKCEERFQKYNIPKRYQNGHKQPLKDYIMRLEEFMEITWRKESKKKRAKGYCNLLELMIKIDTKNELGFSAFNSLKIRIEEIAIEISSFMIDYMFLIMVITSSTSNHFLDELKTIVECLLVEKRCVSNTFVTIIRFIIGSMELAGLFWNNNNNEKDYKFVLNEEKIEDDLVHHIIVEVLRLEVCIYSPEFFPMMLSNDVFFSMSEHLKCNVFEEKLKRVKDKINEWKLGIKFGINKDDEEEDYYCSEMKFLRQVLEDGVHEIWCAPNTTKLILSNLVLL
ncbi:hypothetical protein CsatB_002036 [Cannabis sativa]